MSKNFELHRLIKNGDLNGLQRALNSAKQKQIDVNTYDYDGYTPLMVAVRSPNAGVEMMRLLLEHGNMDQESRFIVSNTRVLSVALRAGDPRKVGVLLEHGIDIHYKKDAGYDALQDAVHGRDVLRDPRLIELLELLIESGVDLNGRSEYQETGLLELSRIGRFDAVKLLLEAGANEDQLRWTPLIRAVAIGSLADVKEAAEANPDFEEVDWCGRTALLVAIQIGEISKVRILIEHGADVRTLGHWGRSALFYAIDSGQQPILKWVLNQGLGVEQKDNSGATPLSYAAEYSNEEAVRSLLIAGADVNSQYLEQSVLSYARTRGIVLALLEAGADPAGLSFEGRRALLGFDPESDQGLLEISSTEFRQGRFRRFGRHNPEKMINSFWEGMIRAGIRAYQPSRLFDGDIEKATEPVWCAQRYGQSITILPDHRIVQCGGEHEDHYDDDFCIYNDVFVHEPDGAISIFGYPESVFPPTDFHTATLMGEHIYLVGSLGYRGSRDFGRTPVYRLSTKTFAIEDVESDGDAPGWIYKHRATRLSAHEIQVDGGKIAIGSGDKEIHVDNRRCFVLDTDRRVWRIRETI